MRHFLMPVPACVGEQAVTGFDQPFGPRDMPDGAAAGGTAGLAGSVAPGCAGITGCDAAPGAVADGFPAGTCCEPEAWVRAELTSAIDV